MQTVQINGMSCGACIKLIKLKFGKLPGISEVIVNDTSGKVQIIGTASFSKEVLQNSLAGTTYTVETVL